MTVPNTTDRESLDYFRRRCIEDSGFVCRELLGWNYDEAWTPQGPAKVNVGTGGVRDNGNYQKIIKLLDRTDIQHKHIRAPRNSYKSTMAQGFCVRQILLNPDVRILYGMKTDAKAAEKGEAIRDALELPGVTQLFGPQEQEGKWEKTNFTVRGRRQANLQEPTFSMFSLESLPTGGHYDYIVVDDLIDQENCKTDEAIENSKKIARLLQPLMSVAGQLIFIGTIYADQDMYYWLEQNPLFYPPWGETLILDAGVKIINDPQKGLDLEVEDTGLTFPHLNLEYLRKKFFGMIGSDGKSYFEFSCQYLNRVPVGTSSPFLRSHFQPLRWATDMKMLSGFLLTDTATSLEDEGCYSVQIYAGLDDRDNAYILDCRVGHWRPPQFVENFFELLEKWQDKVNHVGEVWEEIALVEVFDYAIRADSRARKTKLNSIKIPRSGKSVDSKRRRILKLEHIFKNRQVYVVDTMPRTFIDVDGEKILWDPQGWRDPRTNSVLPGGELVEEFVRYGPHPKQDIADALAMLYEADKKTAHRYCRYRTYTPPQKRLTPLHEVNTPREPRAVETGSWWERVDRDLHGRDDFGF